MQLTIYHRTTRAVWADALFVSVVQCSDEPSGDQVRKAIAAAVRAYGDRGCAERVAQEFGDHPEAAVARMRWACGMVGEVFTPRGLRKQAAEDGRYYPLLACADGG